MKGHAVRSAALCDGLAAVTTLAFAIACAESRGAPPAAPPLDRPASAIPGDLDIAFRIDLTKARRVFGPRVADNVRLEIVDEQEDPATAILLARAIERADAMWVAFRPGLPARLTDNVLVLRGDFRSVDPLNDARGGWAHPVDLGGGYFLFERPRPKWRSAPARAYAFVDERLVFVSEAEIDSVERVLEYRIDDDHVDPPDRGLVSIAARPGPVSGLLAAQFPAIATVLDQATSLQGYADAGEEGLRGTLEAGFATEDDARKAARQADALLSVLRQARGLVGRVARSAESSAVGRRLLIRLSTDGPGLAKLVGCLQGASGC